MVTNEMKASTFTATWKVDLDNMWIVGQMVEKKSKTSPNPYKGTEYRTFDAAQKKWVSVSVDNMGGYGMSTATSADANGMKWMGKMSGAGMNNMQARGTETMKGPKEVAIMFEASMDGKQWMKVMEATCKK
jgi:hypothetical protein